MRCERDPVQLEFAQPVLICSANSRADERETQTHVTLWRKSRRISIDLAFCDFWMKLAFKGLVLDQHLTISTRLPSTTGGSRHGLG